MVSERRKKKEEEKKKRNNPQLSGDVHCNFLQLPFSPVSSPVEKVPKGGNRKTNTSINPLFSEISTSVLIALDV